MKNYINIKGKKIELSEETSKQLEKQFTQKESPSEDIAMGEYRPICDFDWDETEDVLIKDKPKLKIFVNQKFSDNSIFGDYCVFIKCKFGSNCNFGSGCNFGSYCEFGSSCEFGSGCEFGSSCEFGSGCEFGSSCEFGSYCKKQKPYWDENGKNN